MNKKSALLSIILITFCSVFAFAQSRPLIMGTLEYQGCREGTTYIYAFPGLECSGEPYASAERLEGQINYELLVDFSSTYSICACKDVNGNGRCINDFSEPHGRYPDPVVTGTSLEDITGIDILLIDPIPCSKKTEAVPALSYAGILVLVLAMIGSAVWFIRRRKSTS